MRGSEQCWRDAIPKQKTPGGWDLPFVGLLALKSESEKKHVQKCKFIFLTGLKVQRGCLLKCVTHRVVQQVEPVVEVVDEGEGVRDVVAL